MALIDGKQIRAGSIPASKLAPGAGGSSVWKWSGLAFGTNDPATINYLSDVGIGVATYVGVGAGQFGNITAAPQNYPVSKAGTFQKLYVQTAANGFNPSTVMTVTLYVNGVATALTAGPITDGGAQQVSDLVHTVAVVPGDLIDMVATCFATGGFTRCPLAVCVEFA